MMIASLLLLASPATCLGFPASVSEVGVACGTSSGLLRCTAPRSGAGAGAAKCWRWNPRWRFSLVCGPGSCGGMMTGLETDKGGPAHFEMDIYCT